MIELLTVTSTPASSTPPPLWNGVTITTGIGAAFAIGLSVLAIVLTWSSIPKPYWRNESTSEPKMWKLHLVNRGRGSAHDVRLVLLLADGTTWSQISTFSERAMNDVVPANIKLEDGDDIATAKLKYRSHPFSWYVRTKKFHSNDKLPVIVKPTLIKPNF
jgi:hypothetical protein